MADAAQAQLATAFANIATILHLLQQQHQPGVQPPPPAVHVPILDIFQADTPFDLGSRAASQAFNQASAALTATWDGSPDTFPPLLIALRIRAQEAKWNATAPHGILSFTVNSEQKNLLTEYYDIPIDVIEAARVARVDPRARQNSLAFYNCLCDSVDGDLRANLFDQVSNLPTHLDGPLLLKRLTSFTMAATLQLSIQSFTQLQTLDPADHDFKILAVNTKLNHLFILATTGRRSLPETEKIQHTLMAYTRIKQPKLWAQWVCGKEEAFEEGNLLNCQQFMNTAIVKQQKISNRDGGFHGRSTTVSEDVVAMLATKIPSKPSSKRTKTSTPPTSESDTSVDPPPHPSVQSFLRLPVITRPPPTPMPLSTSLAIPKSMKGPLTTSVRPIIVTTSGGTLTRLISVALVRNGLRIRSLPLPRPTLPMTLLLLPVPPLPPPTLLLRLMLLFFLPMPYPWPLIILWPTTSLPTPSTPFMTPDGSATV